MRIHSLDQMRLFITTSPDSTVDFIQILGDVDLSSSHALDLAARELIDADASLIYVDLGGITFMGSTLVAFLVQLGYLDGGLVLCRPTAAARRVIHMTGLDEMATVRPDLPARWPDAAGDLGRAFDVVSVGSCAS